MRGPNLNIILVHAQLVDRVTMCSILSALLVSLTVAAAQSSCRLSPSGNIKPSVASGYRWQVVATGLARPRGLTFDDRGRLLVVESGSGSLSAHTLTEDGGGCVAVNSSNTVVEGMSVSVWHERSITKC
jgi:glucose/arabinose dehydrogenase